MIRTICRACGAPIAPILDLGVQPAANALLKTRDEPQARYPLRAAICSGCTLMQVDWDVPHAELFNRDYPYFSGQSTQWVEHCRAYAEMAWERFSLDSTDLVLEVGSNDGTLLQFFKGRCRIAGVDTSESVAKFANERGIPTTTAEFTRRIHWPRADLIIANNVLAHTPDINEFAATLAATLEIQGIATIEFPWVLHLVEEGQFDTIYHEHYSYLSVTALQILFKRHGLHIFDVEQLPTHGGSLRVYLCPDQVRQEPSVAEAIEREKGIRYQDLSVTAQRCRREFMDFAINSRSAPLWAYGAAAKGNTFLNYCEALELPANIRAVGDTTPAKQGKFLPGTRIPVVSEDALLAMKPDHILILPWNWKTEIIAKLRGRGYAGKFVTAIPKLEIV